MKVNLSNLLCEGNMQTLKGICTYWCKSMPEDNEQFETLRGLLKSQYVKIVDKAADFDYEFVNIMASQASDLVQVCNEFDKKMEEYINQHASVCSTLLSLAGLL